MKSKLIILLLSLFCLNSMAQGQFHHEGKKTKKTTSKKKTTAKTSTSTPTKGKENTVCIKGVYYNVNFSTREATVTYRYEYYENENTYSGNVVIPETVTYKNAVLKVTSIGEEAFSYCSGLTSVTIPNSVTSIGSGAFGGCTSLTSITVDKGNTTYDSRENCNAIIETASNTLIAGCKNTVIPNSVTSIGDFAFYNCPDLTSVTIPNSVTSIGDHAFFNCTGLTSITIPNSVTSIGGNAFDSCAGLTSVEIPNSVTNIREWTFRDCVGLTSIVISNSVTSIGMCAFQDCPGLTSVTIPNSVKSIKEWAFTNCINLKEVTCRATEVPATCSNAFDDIDQSSATLYVPASSMEAYKSEASWSKFGTIKAIGE